jgi:hypothetical protein
MTAVTSLSALDHAAAGDHEGKHFPPCLVALRGRPWVALVKPHKDGRPGRSPVAIYRRTRKTRRTLLPQRWDGDSDSMIQSWCLSIWSSTSCHCPMKSIDAVRLMVWHLPAASTMSSLYLPGSCFPSRRRRWRARHQKGNDQPDAPDGAVQQAGPERGLLASKHCVRAPVSPPLLEPRRLLLERPNRQLHLLQNRALVLD